MSSRFWDSIDTLVAQHTLVIDRPKGSRHPRFQDFIYPLDYGYLDGTTAADGAGIDVFAGTADNRTVGAILVTLDSQKKDAEIKLLLGCTPEEQQLALDILNYKFMAALLVRRPEPDPGE